MYLEALQRYVKKGIILKCFLLKFFTKTSIKESEIDITVPFQG